MEDNYNQQNPQDSNPETPIEPQVPEQQTPPNPEQGLEHPENNQPLQYEQDPQYRQEPQYEQDPQNNQQPFYPQPGYIPSTGGNPPPTNKLHTKLVVAIIVFLIFISGIGVAYAFKDTIINSYHLMTKSPIEYYTYLEKRDLDEILEVIPSDTDKSMENVAFDISSDVTFDRPTLDSLLQSYLGSSLADIESAIGIPIDKIGLDFLVGSGDNLISETVGVELNQKDVITMQLLIDTLKHQILMRIPELSDAYLSQSSSAQDMDADTYQKQLDLLNSDTFTKLLQRYGYLIIDNINKATLKKDVTLSLDTLSADCNKLTITITEEDMRNIVLAMLETAKTDEDILALLPLMGITPEQYLQGIENAKGEINKSSESGSVGSDFYMQIYIDHKGNILGREFTSNDSLTSVNYTLLSKDDYSEYNFFITDNNGDKLIDVTGNKTTVKDVENGDLTLVINNPSSQVMSNISIDVNFEDVRSEYRDGQLFQYGTCTISSLDLMGIQIISVDSVIDDIQYNKTTFQLGASSLVTIDTSRKRLEDYEATLPANDAVIYDTSQTEEYIASIDFEGYLTYLSETLGIDIQLLSSLFQNSITQ